MHNCAIRDQCKFVLVLERKCEHSLHPPSKAYLHSDCFADNLADELTPASDAFEHEWATTFNEFLQALINLAHLHESPH
jgi:hypothetical protein